MPMNAVATDTQPLVGIIMGSQSDWATLEHTANMLKQLGVPFEAEVVSAYLGYLWHFYGLFSTFSS